MQLELIDVAQKVVIRSLYTLILFLFSGVIMWATLKSGLSYETGLIFIVAFLVMELLFSLSRRSRKYAPAVLALALIFTPVFIIYLLIKGLRPSFEDIERQIIKNADLVRGTA